MISKDNVMASRTATALSYTKLPVGNAWNGKQGHWDSSNVQKIGVVFHHMDGSVGGTTAWFNNPNQSTSSNYGLGLDGNIFQWVPENATAYHCGKYSKNQVLIGIECEDLGRDTESGPRPAVVFTDALYESAAKLLADICKFYGWTPQLGVNVFRHKDIIATACPGSLDVERIIKRTTELLIPTPAPSKLITITSPSGANLRVSPTTDSQRLRDFPYGTVLPVDGDVKGQAVQIGSVASDVWYQVSQNQGFVWSGIATPNYIVGETHTAPSQPAPQPQVQVTYIISRQVNGVTDLSNVTYQLPGSPTDAQVQDLLDKIKGEVIKK